MPKAYATAEGTEAYSKKFKPLLNAGNYRAFNGLKVSSVGLGTYLGLPNDSDDKLYIEAIKTALLSGCNLLDSAINYRCMRSERNIGQALKELIAGEKLLVRKWWFAPRADLFPSTAALPPTRPSIFRTNTSKPAYAPLRISWRAVTV